MRPLVAALALMAAACSPPQSSDPIPVEGSATPATAPPEVITAIQTEVPGFVVTTAQSDNSTGAQGYRIAGAANGESYDVLVMHFNEGWRPVIIRRDITWADAPAPVRAAAAGLPEPARVAENRQPGADGVIYELYATGAQSPTMEIRYADGQAAVMPPPH